MYPEHSTPFEPQTDLSSAAANLRDHNCQAVEERYLFEKSEKKLCFHPVEFRAALMTAIFEMQT